MMIQLKNFILNINEKIEEVQQLPAYEKAR